MATIILCDGGCGAQSPDPFTRNHVANQWLRVRAEKNTRFDHAHESDDKLFCDTCAVPVKAALQGGDA